uniref:Uncharacterized protein n=1 Tax=Candidatus Kentrum sp. SD TaxID=2126332 RepID=A0A451BNT2_9GAMM|nr:MAG: hypothetical protein BECKSD772D_GA0070982_10738 [Candidatus Kentron sp. SD]
MQRIGLECPMIRRTSHPADITNRPACLPRGLSRQPGRWYDQPDHGARETNDLLGRTGRRSRKTGHPFREPHGLSCEPNHLSRLPSHPAGLPNNGEGDFF